MQRGPGNRPSGTAPEGSQAGRASGAQPSRSAPEVDQAARSGWGMPFGELLDLVETWSPAYRPLMSGATLADAFDAAMVARGSARRAWRGDLERSDLRPVGITLSGGRAWVHQLRDGTAAVKWSSGQVCRWADLPELLQAVASVQLRVAKAKDAEDKAKERGLYRRESWQDAQERKADEARERRFGGDS